MMDLKAVETKIQGAKKALADKKQKAGADMKTTDDRAERKRLKRLQRRRRAMITWSQRGKKTVDGQAAKASGESKAEAPAA